MKISLNWLKDYLEFSLSLPQLVEKLNGIGLMVEAWEEKDGDVILDVETYANRPDTLGHLGIARELAAALDMPLNEEALPITECGTRTSELADVQIWDEDLCPRYCGLIVRDVKVGPSPDWLRERIEAVGLKPVNNVVDVTNYVLFATAQPIHAFDLFRLKQKKIIIRRAQKGESLKSLEGRELSLSPDMLVIADAERPVALAGIIGGEESAVRETTSDIFIESAYFDPASVRRTRKTLGLETDASYRFERGADISFAPRAAVMAASLLTRKGGVATKEIIDVYSRPRKNKEVILRHRRISDLLGVEVETGFVTRTLKNLGFGVEVHQTGAWKVKCPFFRVDVEREADLIEEVARFYGYNRIPSVVPPLRVVKPYYGKNRDKLARLRQVLFHYGFDEVVNFSFSDREREAVLRSGRKAIEIRNPISVKASLLRTSLMGGLLENAAWNSNRGVEGIHVFETGNIYFWENESHGEQLHLCLLTTGPVGVVHWQGKREETDFYHLKGACEAILTHLRYEPFHFEREDRPCFEEGFSLALVYKGETVGHLGLVGKNILETFSLEREVYVAEINLEALFRKQPHPFRFVPVPRFPGIVRDLSFLADRRISFQDIKKAVDTFGVSNLEGFFLVDRFSGPSIPEDKISLSLRFFFRHSRKTLLAAEVDRLEERIISHLKSAFKIQLREGGQIDNRT